MWQAIVDNLVIAEANSCIELSQMMGIPKSTVHLASEAHKPIRYGQKHLFVERIYPRKVCVVCGESFEDRSRNRLRNTCSEECSKQKNSKSALERYRANKEKGVETTHTTEYVKRLRKRGRTAEERMKGLQSFNEEARENGMSYGEYEAYLHRDEYKISINEIRKKMYGY